MNTEFLLKGNIKFIFLRYIIPSIMGMLGVSLYILADTFFISNGLGTLGISALNISIPIYSLINGIGLLIGTGGATIFSIVKGNGEFDKFNNSFTISIVIGLSIGILFAIFGTVFSHKIAYTLGATEDTISFVNEYIRVIFVCSSMFILNNILLNFIRNDGNPKLAMIGMVISTLANIVLDYIFIYPLNMKMFGAALATGLSPIISCLILMFHFISKKNNFRFKIYRFTLKEIIPIILTGVPAFVTEMATGIVILLFNIVILGIAGDIGVAAYGIIVNVALVCMSLFTGIGQGIQPIISVNYGARKTKRIEKVIILSIILALSMGILLYILGIKFSKEITQIFNSDNSKLLLDMTVNGINLYFISFIFMGINIVVTTIFVSILRPRIAMLISMLRGFIISIPLLFILSSILKLNGVWLTMPFTEIITLVIEIIIVLRLNRLKKI